MSGQILAGRTALVTSSSRNLGAEICRALAHADADVVVNYHTSGDAAAELVDELARLGSGAHRAIAGDLSTPKGTQAFAGAVEQQCGTVDVLVNNSGPFSMTPFLEMDVAEWREVLDANVTTVQQLVRHFAPGMRHAGWGRVVNIGAGSAHLRNHSIYGLAKAALSHLTESLALEVGPELTVNTLAPGQISESAPDVTAIDPTFVDRAVARTPAGRLVRRHEVADLVVMMCQPAFDMVTGATIPVDGGWRFNRF